VPRLRVGINLLWLLPEEAGGAEEFAIRALRALAQEAAGDLDVTLLCNRRFPAAHPDLAGRFETAVAPIDGGSRVARIAIESTWLAREAGRRELDLVHHLNNVVPWVRNRPSVLTIHDLRPLELPETLGRGHGTYLRARLRPSVRNSAVVTTPSAFVRETVVELLDADPSRVLVVSAPLFLSAESTGTDPPGVGIDGPFFLYPAITNPHKNHLTLLEAFAKVTATHPDTLLVLTGAAGPAEDDVTASISRLGLGGRVRRLGRVPQAHLGGLLRDAVALVYPSRYEGFGLPLAEAMALGCPVIASATTALPEVMGEAGVPVDPDDVDGWAEAMLRLLDDQALRATLIARGYERVRSLTPANTARGLIDAYRLATQNG
jgi:glycosyltransferase involved in cell wall biosynthesis